MARSAYHAPLPAGLPTYRVRFDMLSGTTPVSGLTGSLDVWLAEQRDTSATQIVTSGSGRTLLEVDATNMAGVYEINLVAGDVDEPGMSTLRFVAPGADDLLLHVSFVPRTTFGGGI